MDGVLNVYKPAGPTSHDVVDQVRKLFGQKRVGHAGTLDPMATGVLVICLGKATRIVEYLMGAEKQYRARLVLGVSTDSQDSTGEVTAESDATVVTREALEEAAARFVGEIEQVPPMVSAVKHEGQRLYKLAREGKIVERKARQVSVYSIQVMSFEPGPRAEAELVVSCGSGTYIRTLCADIGDALGCGGHMSALERTAVGMFRVEESTTLEKLAGAQTNEQLEERLIGLAEALQNLPEVTVGEEEVHRITRGLPVGAAGVEDGRDVRVADAQGRLLAIAVVAEGSAHPRKVLVDLDL